MDKSFEEWMDTFIEMAQSEGYYGPFLRETFYEQYEAGEDAFHAGREFAINHAEPQCPECLQKCTFEELGLFNGLCEDCETITD